MFDLRCDEVLAEFLCCSAVVEAAALCAHLTEAFGEEWIFVAPALQRSAGDV